MPNYSLVNNLSSTINPNVAYCNAWIPVENNAGRPLYAEASYITNFSDLSISLSAADLNIGAVHITDPNNNQLGASVADVGFGIGALRVLTQDFESVHDDFSIGDRDGKNFASIYSPTSSLNVNVTNFDILTAKQQEQITLEKTLTANSVFGTSKSQPSNVVGIVQLSSVNISDANWLFQVGRGKVEGASLKSFTGYSSAIDGTFQPVWENGVYTFLNSAQQLLLWSDSASDTNVSVYIDGLDSNYNPLNETIVLTNGSTGVTTVNSYFRINGINLTRTPMAVGNIRIGTSNKSNVLAVIPIGTDRSAMTVYTVPAGYTFYLERVNAYCNYKVISPGNDTTPINAYYRSYTTRNGLTNIILQSPFYNNYSSLRISPRGYPEKTDCQWQCRVDNSYTLAIGLQVEGVLISNSAL